MLIYIGFFPMCLKQVTLILTSSDEDFITISMFLAQNPKSGNLSLEIFTPLPHKMWKNKCTGFNLERPPSLPPSSGIFLHLTGVLILKASLYRKLKTKNMWVVLV
eukprot:GFUD01137521.1.p1 GENE.GFUD01137521.1~~GFUD01137521.1.p1  ORF type:complete len:105 (+),score=5.14 GFUD01137521.1:205-519(+)